MNNQIKVSVIIPVYQVENYLERAIDSVLAQTLEEKEIILVDDGSYDASPQICDRYAQQYPGLIHVIHKENDGLGTVSYTHLDVYKRQDIVVKNVTMQFKRVKDEATSIKELIVRTIRGQQKYEMFTALNDISLSLIHI